MRERDTATINEIAEILGLSRIAVLKRAEKGNWPFIQGPRKIKLYYIEGLPQEIKLSIMAHRAKKMAENIEKKQGNSFEEDCIEMARAVKLALKKSGLSREQLVDEINSYYNFNKLSIHMFNHYLSKPAEYPIPGYLIYGIQRITGSLEPCRTLADSEGAKVITGDEVRQMTLGKIDENILELQRLKKELRRK
jgi:hypothetical protein